MNLYKKFCEASNELDVSLEYYNRIVKSIKLLEDKLRECNVPGVYEVELGDEGKITYGWKQDLGYVFYFKSKNEKDSCRLLACNAQFMITWIDKIIILYEGITKDLKANIKRMQETN